ncbi:hypothetical protein LH51_15255 [Nitrincola sp. A-D6]|uniref:hypothetical protein n=1 Tax=Nitrincola sp. A-D6 TaxID=1545442 RepID=UPI00051FB0E3|nr:hypothetical protein [Nitrincola sp. A-D6]KGK41374.1 hypothetical protein LH51_15255 [Nitrincola sp. A-D6]
MRHYLLICLAVFLLAITHSAIADEADQSSLPEAPVTTETEQEEDPRASFIPYVEPELDLGLCDS